MQYSCNIATKESLQYIGAIKGSPKMRYHVQIGSHILTLLALIKFA